MAANQGKQYPMTEEGARKLRQELDELTGPRRQDLAKRLRHAIQQGDLTENADYLKAKEDQAFLEGRIQELELILKDVQIVAPDPQTDQVSIGRTVVVVEDPYQPEIFRIVGVKEADPAVGKISHESPIGMALIGKRTGDRVTVETPGGTLRLKILEIR